MPLLDKDSPAWSAKLGNWYLLTCAEVFILCPSTVPFPCYADMNIDNRTTGNVKTPLHSKYLELQLLIMYYLLIM